LIRYLVIFTIASGVSLAQVSSGSLIGDVRDPKQQAIAEVVVTARNNATGFTRTSLTGPGGAYRIDDLLPGAYTLTARRAGFKTLSVFPITVEIDQKAQYDLELQPGSENDTVTVTSDQSPVQTAEASEGFLLGSNMMQQLPLATRNLIGLITLGPGAVPRQLGGFTHDIINDLQAGRGAVALNAPVNGARSTANSYILDGAYNTDRNTLSVAVIPPLDSVEEFRAQTSLAPAEFPASGGAVVDVVTRSGGQSFHGSAFEFFHNEASDAKGFFSTPGLPSGIFRENQYGASLGGPLAKSTYFFAAYEGIRGRSSNPTQHLVPTATVRGGDFTSRAPLFDPLNPTASGGRMPFAGNMIPGNRLDPITQKYLGLYEPLPNNVTNPASNYLDTTPNEHQSDNASFRIDRSWSERNRLFARYTINDDRTLLAGAFPERPTSEQLRAQQSAIGHIFASSSWVNENHFSFTRLRVFDLPVSAFGANVLQQLGIGGFPDDPFIYGLPSLVVTNFEMVQDSDTLPQLQRDNLWSASSSISRMQGRHNWKAGVELQHFTMAYLQSQFARGQFQFNGTYTQDPLKPNGTGDPFADFLLGFASQTQRQTGTARAYFRQNDYAAYVRDDWRIHPRFTVTAGLRYEYLTPFTEDRGNLFNLDYSTLPAAPVLRRVDSATKPDHLGFAPRIGIAARLPHVLSSTRETVFRAGYGLYFSPEIAVESYDLVRNGVRNVINRPSGTAPSLTLANGFPQNGSTGLPSYFGVDENARTAYVQQWSSSLQHALPGNVLFEVAYVGSKGTRLGRFRRFNTPAHTELGLNLPPRPGDLQSLRTFPELGPIFQIQHNSNSIYHSLQIKAEKRLTARLAFLASFVWSKSLDDADTIVPGFFASFGAQNEGNLHAERGLSFSNVPRRFSAGYVYSLPAAPVFRFASKDWQLSGNITLQDGTPLNPVYFATDYANSGTPNRPNVVAGQPILLPENQRDADHFYNPAAFTSPAPFTFGNAGRNILPGIGNEVVDLALHRKFRIHEGQTLEFRAEAFNLFNHPNLGIPGPYPDFGPFFGKAFSVGDPRRMRFALRYDF
jgi:hypothetical protein